MTTLQDFLAERGGSFTSEDIQYLANIGLQALISGAIAPQAVVASDQEIPYSTPPETARVVNTPFGVDVELCSGEPCDPATLSALSQCVTAICRNVNGMPRTLVVGSRFGEEVIAVASGSGQLGDGIEVLYDLAKVRSDSDFEVMFRNLYVQSPVTANLPNDPYSVHAEQYAAVMDAQEFSVIVLCEPKSADEIRAWVRHLLPTGLLIVTEANELSQQVFGESLNRANLGKVAMVSIAKWKQDAAEALAKEIPPLSELEEPPAVPDDEQAEPATAKPVAKKKVAKKKSA